MYGRWEVGETGKNMKKIHTICNEKGAKRQEPSKKGRK